MQQLVERGVARGVLLLGARGCGKSAAALYLAQRAAAMVSHASAAPAYITC